MTKWIIGYRKEKIFEIRKDVVESQEKDGNYYLPYVDIIEEHDDEKGD